MPVIAMSVPCTIALRSGSDVYGMPKYSAPVRTVCAVVLLTTKGQHSTVRADSGATRGHADEQVADAILLVGRKQEPTLDSTVSVRGVALRVISVQHRIDVMGRLDHYEIRCSIEQ